MGRRRTLINDFGANWATGRVSLKKNARLAGVHDGNLNCRSVAHRRLGRGSNIVSRRPLYQIVHAVCSPIFHVLLFFSSFFSSSPVSLVSLRVSFYFFLSPTLLPLFCPYFGGWEGRGGAACTKRDGR